jgi:heat shock protein HslJ
VRRPLTIAALAALAYGVNATGCGWDDSVDSLAATEGLPSTRADIEAHDWVLDLSDSSLSAESDNPVTLTVDRDEISGAGPCNAYRGTFELARDDSVEISDVAVTRMACDPDTMDAEAEYLAALEDADHVKVDVDDEGRDDRDRLVLKGPDDLRLAFRSFDARDELAGDWTITGVATGDSIDSMLLGTEPTLSFSDDGTMTVDTGCNTGGGDWDLDGDAITLDSIRITLRACDEPRGAGNQEAAVLAALDAAERVEVTPGSLTLLDGDGRIVLVAVQR